MKRIAAVFVFLAIFCTMSYGFTDGQSADLVLGKTNFTSDSENIVDGKAINGAKGVCIDSTNNRVYVSDTGNDRVLWWNGVNNFTTGTPADGVIGQLDLGGSSSGATTASSLQDPRGLAVDAVGNLYVADRGNNRVLIFNYPVTTGMSASTVLGQTSFTTSGTVLSATGLNYPSDVALDSLGNVYVADTYNRRVLKYAPPTSTTGMSATSVLGKTTFTSNATGRSAVLMSYCGSVEIDPTNDDLYVSDYTNKRILKFAAATTSTSGATATIVLGQTGTTYASNTPLSYATREVYGMAFDSHGNLFVSDANYSRIIKFTNASTLTTAHIPSLVVGQINLSSWTNVTSATNMREQQGIAIDSSDNIYACDQYANRVLKFPEPVGDNTVASQVIGQSNMTSGVMNLVRQNSLYGTSDAIYDPLNNRLYVADTYNNRVLWWNDPETFTSGKNADGVIGQPDFSSGATNQGSPSAATLYSPEGLAVDSSGNLYISEAGNNRVLKYNSPITSGMSASVVVGTTDMTTSGAGGLNASELNSPRGICVDVEGNLYVADYARYRVLRFNAPITTGDTADVVFGQVNMTSNAQACTAAGMGVAVDVTLDAAGNLYVADFGYRRVLRYTPPFTSGMSADLVLGQADFVSGTTSGAQNRLGDVWGVTLDASGKLYATDQTNNRVVRYSPPFTSGMNADLVLGQVGYNAGTDYGLSATATGDGFHDPQQSCFDAGGNLYIADQSANRLLMFKSNDYTISGYIKDAENVAISGISVSLSGAGTATVTTNASGYYEFTNLTAGSYTVTPSAVIRGMTPSSRTHTLVAFGKSAQNYVAGEPVSVTSNLNAGEDASLSTTGSKGDVTVAITANTFSANVSVTVNPEPTLPAVPSTQTGFTGTNVGVEITLSDATLTLKKPVTLTVGYRAADIVGLTAGKLVLCYYNETMAKWIPLPSVVDETARTVQARVTHFSLFQIMQVTAASTLDDAKAYPNPFLGGVHPLINFMNLTAAADVSIYTLRGEKVAGVVADSAGLASWDGRAASGALVGPGIYLAFINDGVNKKTIKLAVER